MNYVRTLSFPESWECPEGFSMAQGKCFKVLDRLKTRMEAELECRTEEAILAKPGSVADVMMHGLRD